MDKKAAKKSSEPEKRGDFWIEPAMRATGALYLGALKATGEGVSMFAKTLGAGDGSIVRLLGNATLLGYASFFAGLADAAQTARDELNKNPRVPPQPPG